MKKRNIKVAKKFLTFLMALIIVVSFAGIGLSVFNLISFNVEASKYIYLLLGVFLLPYEFITQGRIVGMFQEQGNIVYTLIISIAIFVLTIVLLTNASRMYNGKYSSVKRAIFGIIANVLIFIFTAIFVFGAVMITLKYNQMVNGVNDIGPEFIKIIMTNFGFNLIVVKEIVVAYFGLLVCLFALIVFVIGMFHKSTKVKIITSINFYSDEYEEDKAITNSTSSVQKSKEEKKEHVIADIPENDPKAKNLIKKIMQLEELKNSGKITNTDYTRLRQKAIRRYKN